MSNTQFFCRILAAAAVLSIGACTTLPPALTGQSSSSATIYSPDQAQRTERVRMGTVITVHSVLVDASAARKATGSGIGGALGALLGQQVGSGNGKKFATVAGALAGLVGGNRIAAAAYKEPGLAVTVELDGGEIVTVTQAADVPLTVGQRVQVVGSAYGNSVSRVTPLESSHHTQAR
jgi:outer membrane lipoprotein SlyB